MSTTIDQKVVEMKFDNKNFESNVKDSMSTLEKLKQSLKLTEASKGLENVNNAAKNFNLAGMGNAIETVRTKFSALEVMGITALANITNSAVNTGKRIASEFTIKPVITGFQEYETQINAVQTILANTQNKGSTLDDVNKALDELNTYADKTIYNFTEMTRNIGTFTAAGVDLDKSVTSIKGIANLAAVSGSTSQQASVAMYQLSQALASGKVALQDWNSVVNAGMGGQVFQEALKRTARQMGKDVDGLIEKYGSFRESLTKGNWLTGEVLTETLTQLSGAYSKADLIAQGYSEEQAKEITQLAETAVNAATKVKTFTQLWDTLKEAAQSGWTQTWELIIGDFEEAKTFLTKLSDRFGDIINKSSNARNKLLEDALGSKWDVFIKKVNKAGVSTKDFKKVLVETAKESGIPIDKLIKKYGSLNKVISAGKIPTEIFVKALKKLGGVTSKSGKSTGDMTKKLEKFQKVVNQVWNGDYNNGEERVKALTKAGYDYNKVQSLVNKTVDGHKLTIEDLSDAQLKNVGYTDKQVKAIRKLAKEAEKSGTPLNKLIQDIGKPSGRDLLLGSVTNILNGIGRAIGSVQKAWKNIFPPTTSSQLYNVIEGFNSLTSKLVMSKETSKNLTKTFEVLFAILDIGLTVIGGPIKYIFEGVVQLLSKFNINILEVTASISDSILSFRKWIKENNLFTKGIEFIIPYLSKASKAIREWFNSLKEQNLSPKEMANAIISGLSNAVQYIGSVIIELKNTILKGTNSIPGDMIAGLVNGIRDKAGYVGQVLVELGTIIIEKIKGVLGIHSPSVVFFFLGAMLMQGLILGIQNGLPAVWEVLSGIGNKIVDMFKNFFSGLDMERILSIGLGIGALVVVKKIADALNTLAAPLEGLGDMFSSIGDAFDKFGKVLNAKAWEIKAKALRNLAITIAILVGSIALLTFLDPGKIWQSVGVIVTLATIMGVLAVVVGKFGPTDAIKFNGFALAIVSLAASLLIMSFALKNIASMEFGKFIQSIAGLTVMIFLLSGLMTAYGLFVKGKAAQNIDKAGITLTKMALTMLLMAYVMKQVSKLKPNKLLCGFVSIVLMSGLFVGLIAMTKLVGKNADKVGGTLLKMSAAMLIMVIVMKQVSKLKPDELVAGFVAIGLFSAFFVGLIAMTKLMGRNATKVGSTLMGIAGSMLILVIVIKIVSGIDAGSLAKGLIAITFLSAIIMALIVTTRLAPNGGKKLAGTLLAISISIGILAGISILLGMVDIKTLAKGIIAVGLLSTMMTFLIIATRGASDCKGNIIAMTVAIGVMAIAVAALSMIDTKKLAVATMALSTLIGMFALLVKASGSATNSVTSIVAIGVMALSIVGLVIALYFLSSLPIEQMKAAVFSLSELILSLSVSMTLIGNAGNISVTAMITVVLMTGVVAALAYMLHKLKDLPIESTFGIASSLSILLLSLSSSCLILGAVGLIGPAAFIGLGMLAGLVAEIASLALIVAGLSTAWPEFETLLNKGMPILEKISKCIGKIFGNIVAGFAEGVMSCIPAIGSNLSAFMENSKGFIDGMSSINPKILKGATALAGAILALTAAELIQSIASFLGGNISFAMFGSELGALANGINNFAANLGTFDKKQLKSIEYGSKAIKILAEASKTIPKEGGL